MPMYVIRSGRKSFAITEDRSRHCLSGLSGAVSLQVTFLEATPSKKETPYDKQEREDEIFDEILASLDYDTFFKLMGHLEKHEHEIEYSRELTDQ